MKTCRLLLFALGGIAWVAAISNSFGAGSPEEVRELVGAHCVSCHGEKEAKGNLRLDGIASSHWEDFDLFDDMLTMVEEGEMPPENSDNPLSDSDRSKLLEALKVRHAELGKRQLAGTYRKLTRLEYNNALTDVFGFPLEKLSNLPFDSDHDIKRLADHQVITSFAMNKYYRVANEYLDRHLIDEDVAPRYVSFTADSGKDLFGRQYTSRAGALAGRGNQPIFNLRNPVDSYAEEGVYELEFNWYCFYSTDKGTEAIEEHKPVPALKPPLISLHLNPQSGIEVLNPAEDQEKGRIKLCDITKPIQIRLKNDLKFLSFRGPGNQFRDFDRTDPRYVKVAESDLPKEEKRAALKAISAELMKELHGEKTMFLLVRGATFRGPLGKQESPFNVRLFGAVKRTDPIDAAYPIIRRVATKLFRRPVPEPTLESYYEIARSEHAVSKNLYQAVKVTLNSMLCSPLFLFKYEGAAEELDDYMIASRLAFFLWNGVPDDELLELAAEGKLSDPSVRRAQAQRLLADRPKSDRFTETFTHQWLGLHKFGAYAPNEAYLRTDYFANLKPHFESEPQQLFNELLHNNMSALNFIDSDFVVWNQHLKSHYYKGANQLKLGKDPRKEIARDEFVKNELVENPDDARGGLLGMASILSLTTDGENTQPILRGVWIANHLLGMEIEAPASVPAIEVNLENVSKPREILSKHKTDPSCYECHVKFDDFGLAMENFNVIGQWKLNYVHPVQNEKGRFELVTKDPIDSKADGPDGEPMEGVAGVKRYLMSNKDTVMKHLISQMFSYALGREDRYRDRDAIKLLLKGMRENDYKLRDLVLEMVESESFVRR